MISVVALVGWPVQQPDPFQQLGSERGEAKPDCHTETWPIWAWQQFIHFANSAGTFCQGRLDEQRRLSEELLADGNCYTGPIHWGVLYQGFHHTPM